MKEKREYFERVEKDLVTISDKKVGESLDFIMSKIKSAYAMGVYDATRETQEINKLETKENISKSK